MYYGNDKFCRPQCAGLEFFDECTCKKGINNDEALQLRRRNTKILKFMLGANILSFKDYCERKNLEMDHFHAGDSFTFYCHELIIAYHNMDIATRQGAMDLDLSDPDLEDAKPRGNGNALGR